MNWENLVGGVLGILVGIIILLLFLLVVNRRR